MNWQFRQEQKNHPVDCCGVEPLLSLYADGAASPAEAERAKSHILECEDCRQHYQWITETSRTLALRPIVSPPADLSLRIAQAIAAEDARSRQFVTRRPLVFRKAHKAWIAAASLLVVAAFASHSYFSHLPLTQPPTAVAVMPPVVPPVIHHPTLLPTPGKTGDKVAIKTPPAHALQSVKPKVNTSEQMADVPTEASTPKMSQPKLRPATVHKAPTPELTANLPKPNSHVFVPGTHPGIPHAVKPVVSNHQPALEANNTPTTTQPSMPINSAPTLPTKQPTVTPAPTVVVAVPTEPTAPIHTISLDTNAMLRSHIPPPQMVSGKVYGSPHGSVHMASEYGTDSFDNGVSNTSGTVTTVHSQ